MDKLEGLSRSEVSSTIIQWGYETHGDFGEACRIASEMDGVDIDELSEEDQEWVKEDFLREFKTIGWL